MSQAERDNRKVTRLKEKVATVVRDARVAANDAADARFSSKLNRAHARARDAEKTAAAAGRKFSRHTATVEQNKELRALVNEREDEAQRERERADEIEVHAAHALKMCEGMPDLAPIQRKAPAVIRKMIMHQLARRTPPSAVVPNIVAVLKYAAPSLLQGAHLPNVDFVRKVRREMGRIARTLAASRLARAKRVLNYSGTIPCSIFVIVCALRITPVYYPWRTWLGAVNEPSSRDNAWATPLGQTRFVVDMAFWAARIKPSR